jgi:hypothetical protein
LANIVGDVDSLHVEIDNLNDPLVGFCFIRSIDIPLCLRSKPVEKLVNGYVGVGVILLTMFYFRLD